MNLLDSLAFRFGHSNSTVKTIAVFGSKHSGKSVLWAMLAGSDMLQDDYSSGFFADYFVKNKWRISNIQDKGSNIPDFAQIFLDQIVKSRRLLKPNVPSTDFESPYKYTINKRHSSFGKLLAKIFRSKWKEVTLANLSFYDLSGEWFDKYENAYEVQKTATGLLNPPDIYDEYLSKCDGLLFMIDARSLTNNDVLSKFSFFIKRLNESTKTSPIRIPTIICISKADSVFLEPQARVDGKKFQDMLPQNKERAFYTPREFIRKFPSHSLLVNAIENYFADDMIQIAYLSALGVVTKRDGKSTLRYPNVTRGQGGEPRVIFVKPPKSPDGGSDIEHQLLNVKEVFNELFSLMRKQKS